MKNQTLNHGTPLVAAVVSPSPLLRRRIGQTLGEAGFKVVEMPGASKLAKSQRQRPFAVLFLDVRGPEGQDIVRRCFQVRPGERYVLVRDAHAPDAIEKSELRLQPFGTVTEAFSSTDIAGWGARAAAEERQQGAEPPLEDLLYDRFRSFLHQLGPAPIKDLHELVWERVERPLLKAVMEWAEGNQTRAAGLLGIHRNTLRAKLKALDLAD
jgi:Fis family transcriptional regulator